MAHPGSPYIEERNGGLYVAWTAVSLDSVLINFRQGASPEQIVQAFPSVELSQVRNAAAYYIENEAVIDSYLSEGEQEFASAPRLSQMNPVLFARLEAARE